jgi:hypothetical protein
MLEPAEQPTKPPRTWRPMVAWTLGILAALGLAWFVGAVAWPVWQVRGIAKSWEGGRYHPMYAGRFFSSEIAQLGGPASASRKLGIYLRMPVGSSENRCTAAAILGECGDPALPELRRLLEDRDARVRQTAAEALGTFSR